MESFGGRKKERSEKQRQQQQQQPQQEEEEEEIKNEKLGRRSTWWWKLRITKGEWILARESRRSAGGEGEGEEREEVLSEADGR